MRDSEPSQRQLRVGEQIRHALARALSRRELHDPILNDTPITVAEVRCSPDLKSATVYVMPLGGQHMGEILVALNRARAFLRGQVSRALQLKHTPSLRFLADETFDEASRIDRLLKQPEVARDLAASKDSISEDDSR